MIIAPIGIDDITATATAQTGHDGRFEKAITAPTNMPLNNVTPSIPNNTERIDCVVTVSSICANIASPLDHTTIRLIARPNDSRLRETVSVTSKAMAICASITHTLRNEAFKSSAFADAHTANLSEDKGSERVGVAMLTSQDPIPGIPDSIAKIAAVDGGFFNKIIIAGTAVSITSHMGNANSIVQKSVCIHAAARTEIPLSSNAIWYGIPATDMHIPAKIGAANGDKTYTLNTAIIMTRIFIGIVGLT